MTAVIIDDEYWAIRIIVNMLKKHFPLIDIIGTFELASAGIDYIIQHKPDLLFLDIRMPEMTGFDVLDALSSYALRSKVIFTTSYDQYAIKAIKYGSFDYLLKPINEKEFITCIERSQHHYVTQEQVAQLKDNFNADRQFDRIAISHMNGMSFFNVDDIIMMRSDNNYTHIHAMDQASLLASKTLGYFVTLLEERPNYFRCHKQYLINTNFIKEYKGGEDNAIIMNGNLTALLSRSQRKKFLAKFRMP